MSLPHGIRLEGTRFWVTHRRREYGPFDYEWSADFHGVALLYGDCKFGEYCSQEELFADLRPFRLPMRVVEVTAIVMGCVLLGVMRGLTEPERAALIADRLCDFGHERFVR